MEGLLRVSLSGAVCLWSLFDGICVYKLTFLSDGESVIAIASSTGHIALWDLSAKGRLLHIIRGAHDAAKTAIEWTPGQPVLISSGEDNSVKVRTWYFLLTLKANKRWLSNGSS